MILNPLLLGGDDTYTISRSLRFRSSANAYLSRTPSVAGNRKTWTYSVWVKRGALSPNISGMSLLDAGRPNNPWTLIGLSTDSNYSADNGITVATTAGVSPGVYTSASYRDPSSWYHIVVAMDTTQATAANRIKVYVNGVQQSINSFNIPAQNYDTYVNSTTSHSIGALSNGGGSNNFDGYLAEVNLIDGQALTPSSFGAFNATTGVWQPKKYTGSYGTNGFYLPFTNNASTTTLGYDFSPNGNNWTTNNISLTAGSTYDSMTDVPTLTSATAANYCVMNPLYKGPNISAINANLQTSWASTGNFHETIAATIAVNSGKWYWEITKNDTRTDSETIGIIRSDVTQSNMNGQMAYGQSASPSYSWSVEGNKYKDSASGGAYGSAWTTNGDIIGVALDLSTNPGTITMYKNGVSQGTMYSDISTSFSWIPAVSGYGSGATSSFIANFGQRPFSYTPPSGFVALNTYNLPTPTISNGAAHMAATTYVGNGANRSISNAVNGVSFQPDFVWVKNRTNAYDHNTYDSLRPQGSRLITNLTNAEGSTTTVQVNSFNSDGFGLGTYIGVNESGSAFVGWQWKAGGTPAVTNTAGSITSQVSANTAAGFSVVTYTGTGANATVGHGLGVAPQMVIVKARNLPNSIARPWAVWHTGLSATEVLFLNDTAAKSTGATTYWNSTLPTSTVFSLGNEPVVNGSIGTVGQYVAYCFAAVPGYSAFGSYTGNGSTDGPFVYTGFRPRFVLVKCSSNSTASTVWTIWDTSRSPYNASVNELYANSSAAEGVDSNGIDILSNGFKPKRNSEYANLSGWTYIYMAFAESPFKTSLAR